MTRLTNALREKMANILLLHRFNEQGTALAKRSVELFEVVYNDKYDAETRKDIVRIQKRHRSAFANKTRLAINVRGMRFDIGERYIGKGSCHFMERAKPHPVFSEWSNYTYIDCEIAIDLARFAEDDQQFCKDIDKARGELNAVLASFSTERALAEGWPEVMPLIGHVLTETVRGTNLPATRIALLNEAFGIPAIEAPGEGDAA